MILVDAGPLVALIHADDRNHERCKETLLSLNEAMFTVWPAFTEAMYLLNFSADAQDLLWEVLRSGAVRMAALDDDDAPRMRALMKKYRDLPMDLADAALVRVAEREKIRRIFTIDRRDFEIYRPQGLGRVELFP